MKRIQNLIMQFFPPTMPLKAGIYHYQSPPDAPKPLRYHLRIEPGGEGILIINAHTVLHLNQTAAEYAYHLIQQTPPDVVAKTISQRYPISKAQAGADYQNLKARIETLFETPDLAPDTFLDFDRENLYSAATSAPYRLDCAVTYQLQGEDQSLAPTDRVKRELTTADWSTILQKAWNAGIPQVVFTGGEATLRPDLPELIVFAGRLGMVTGLLTNGVRLLDQTYLQSLLQSGLDHCLILLDPANGQSWQAVQTVIAEDISLTVHVTLTPSNFDQFPSVLERLVGLQIKNISLSAADPALKGSLEAAREKAIQSGMNLVWDLPVPYSKFNPVAFELSLGGEVVPQGAGKAWLYVEPDGDVLLSQGMDSPIGNLLTDAWEQIWKNATAAAD